MCWSSRHSGGDYCKLLSKNKKENFVVSFVSLFMLLIIMFYIELVTDWRTGDGLRVPASVYRVLFILWYYGHHSWNVFLGHFRDENPSATYKLELWNLTIRFRFPAVSNRKKKNFFDQIFHHQHHITLVVVHCWT